MTTASPPVPRHRSLVRHRLAGFGYRDARHARFATVCAHSGPPFTGPTRAQAVIDSLDGLVSIRSVDVYAYCLMPDHLHLLLQLLDGRALGTVVGSFKRYTSRQHWSMEHRGPLWQPRFHGHIVRRSEDGNRIAQYIVDNPVRSGLVSAAEACLWSGTPDLVERGDWPEAGSLYVPATDPAGWG